MISVSEDQLLSTGNRFRN